MIQRVFGWLAAKPHEDIFSMVLTQRVVKGETLVKARERMRAKESEYMLVLKERGLISGAIATHVVWSLAAQGWHYHVHLLLELPGGQWTPLDLRELWVSVAAPEEVQAGEDSSRLVVGRGPPDAELVGEPACPDFWSESRGALARAVQYPVRDIAQGVSAVRCGGDRQRVRECVSVLLKHAKGWKLRRTVGQWRKPAPLLQPTVMEEAAAKAAAPPPAKPVRLGTVHRLSRQAWKGDIEARRLFVLLEASIRNNTDFGKRFVAFCRSAAARGVT